MRLIFTIIFSTVIYSCSKPVYSIDSPRLMGDWQWYKTRNAFAPVETPSSTGKSWILSLHVDSSYIHTGDYYPCTQPAPTGWFSVSGKNFTLMANGLMRPFNYTLNYTQDSLILDAGSDHDAPIYYLVRKY